LTASQVISRSGEVAVNCFTGSFAVLTGIKGNRIKEQTLFERGDGYLFQAGLDESRFPEYIFPVEEAGVLGMRRSGFDLRSLAIGPEPVAQAAELVGRFGGVVVWCNTAHLDYASFYRKTSPYLHSVTITDVAADRSSLGVYDSMVVDIEPFSCQADLDAGEFGKAVTDRIRSEAHDCMGNFYVTSGTDGRSEPPSVRQSLGRQALRFATEDRFRNAVRKYRDLNFECLTDPTRREFAARRLFIHSTVLYAVPSLTLLSRSLEDARTPRESVELCQEAIRHWRALGVLALRLQATASPGVLDRLDKRFEIVDDVTTQLWSSLADDEVHT
jgi:hypothetical protein